MSQDAGYCLPPHHPSAADQTREKGAKKLNVPRNGGMSFPNRWTKHLQRQFPQFASRSPEPEHMTSKTRRHGLGGRRRRRRRRVCKAEQEEEEEEGCKKRF